MPAISISLNEQQMEYIYGLKNDPLSPFHNQAISTIVTKLLAYGNNWRILQAQLTSGDSVLLDYEDKQQWNRYKSLMDELDIDASFKGVVMKYLKKHFETEKLPE